MSGLRIRNKIWLSIIIVFLGYAASLFYNSMFQRETTDKLDLVADAFFPAAQYSQKAASAFDLQLRQYQDAVLMGEVESIQKASNIADEILQYLGEMEALPGIPNKDEIASLQSSVKSFTKDANLVYSKLANEEMVDQELLSGLNQRSNTIKSEIHKKMQTFREKLKTQILSIKNRMAAVTTHNLWIFAIVAALSALLSSLIINRFVVKPVTQASEVTQSVQSSGDLSKVIPVNSHDEIGQLAQSMNIMMQDLQARASIALDIAKGSLDLNVDVLSDKDLLGSALHSMVEELNRIISDIKTVAHEVSQGAYQLSDGSTALSQGATQQAASLEEISSSMAEIGSQASSNADNASQASKIADATRTEVENGTKQMVNLAAAIEEMNQSSQETSKIIKVIDDIAFQTNLLALNAAVEAARAGKHGKGFAVVADEVRNLAGRSAKAASETTELIENSLKKVQNSTRLATETKQALDTIRDYQNKVVDIVMEIDSASKEQTEGLHQINTGLSQISSSTQQATANAEETASTAQLLNDQAQRLQSILTHFTIRGGSHSPKRQSPSYSQEAPKAQRVATPAPSASIGWGDIPESSTMSPEDVIALDDNEYGRY